jgi:8-oxo-dGTP diphosphatase
MIDIVQRAAMKAVIINPAGRVLILCEAKTYKDDTNVGRWHIPGGRVEPGEHFTDALRREVQEETGLTIEIAYPVYVGEWRPVIRGVPHQIIATYIVCSTQQEDMVLSDEHQDYKWILPTQHAEYNLLTPEDDVIEAYLRLKDKNFTAYDP